MGSEVTIACPWCDDDERDWRDVPKITVTLGGSQRDGIVLDDIEGECPHVKAEREGLLTRAEVDRLIDEAVEALDLRAERWRER